MRKRKSYEQKLAEYEVKKKAWDIARAKDLERLTDMGYKLGDRVAFYIPPMIPSGPAAVYHGTIKKGKHGDIYVSGKDFNQPKVPARKLSFFNNPWEEVS